MRTTISSRGQTAVPAEVRRRFHLGENSQLEWMVEGGVITVLPVPLNAVSEFRGSLKGRFTVRDLLEERRADRARDRSRR